MIEMPELPEDLCVAVESGRVTAEQLRQLIEIEADVIGLRYDEARALAAERRLPHNAIGGDLQLLFGLMP